jgi:hypothetical protein
MTNRGKSTAIGAGIGAVAGAVLKGVALEAQSVTQQWVALLATKSANSI